MKNQTKQELINANCKLFDAQRALGAELERKVREVLVLRETLARSQRRENVLSDAVRVLHERYYFNPFELAQLGIGTFVKGKDGERDSIIFTDLSDIAQVLNDDNKAQQTAAKFRIIKAEFQKHQYAVSSLLDRACALANKNVLTSQDMKDFRQFRNELSQLIHREI